MKSNEVKYEKLKEESTFKKATYKRQQNSSDITERTVKVAVDPENHNKLIFIYK